MAGPEEVEVRATAPKRSLSNGETVLVVEDDKAVRDLTTRMLERMGHKVLAAANGPQAIEIAGQFPSRIALLLTDVVLPKLNGCEVAEALAVLRPDIRILFLSGYTESAVLNSAIVKSGIDFLPKPFTEEALALKTQEILARGS